MPSSGCLEARWNQMPEILFAVRGIETFNKSLGVLWGYSSVFLGVVFFLVFPVVSVFFFFFFFSGGFCFFFFFFFPVFSVFFQVFSMFFVVISGVSKRGSLVLLGLAASKSKWSREGPLARPKIDHHLKQNQVDTCINGLKHKKVFKHLVPVGNLKIKLCPRVIWGRLRWLLTWITMGSPSK